MEEKLESKVEGWVRVPMSLWALVEALRRRPGGLRFSARLLMGGVPARVWTLGEAEGLVSVGDGELREFRFFSVTDTQQVCARRGEVRRLIPYLVLQALREALRRYELRRGFIYAEGC